MIKIGYLEGYNALNVPSFRNKSTRDAYFNSIANLVSIDAYYPPYYTNVIKLDINQVSQSIPYNFVILVHNNEYYYYFIDHFNYINESVYEIYINMDTVLTIMFDIKITNAFINRKSIKRWTSQGKINREYIRNNLSEGIFDVDNFTYKSPNKYVIVTTSSHYANEGDDYRHTNYDIDNTLYPLGYYTFIIPIPSNVEDLYSSTALVKLQKGNNTPISVANPSDTISEFIDDPYVINMTYVESEYLDRMLNTTWEVVSLNSLICHIDYPTSDSIVKFSDTGLQCCIAINGFSTDVITSDEYITIKSQRIPDKNTGVNTLFNFKYVPQIIDENYIQIKYGNVTGFSSYPLHQSKSGEFKLYDITDVTTGNQGFFIRDKDDNDNRYNTYLFTTSTNFDLITDAWKAYQAQNKGTLSTGLQLQAVNTLYNTVQNVGLSSMNASLNQYGQQAYGNLYASDNKKYANANITSNMYGGQSQISNAKAGFAVTSGLMQAANITANYKINKENLEYTPDTIKGRNSMLSMAFSKYLSPYVEISCCKDIETCAKKLEEFGYKVNEILENNSGLYINEITNIRYYYNCLGLNIKTYLLLKFIPNDILNDFIDRLTEGIRLYNMSNVNDSNNTISSCMLYDNVETEEIINE